MGYYSDILCDCKIKQEYRDMFYDLHLHYKKTWKNYWNNQHKPKKPLEFTQYFEYFDYDKDTGEFIPNEINLKWYEDFAFLSSIFPYLEINSSFVFTGEDGEKWGYLKGDEDGWKSLKVIETWGDSSEDDKNKIMDFYNQLKSDYRLETSILFHYNIEAWDYGFNDKTQCNPNIIIDTKTKETIELTIDDAKRKLIDLVLKRNNDKYEVLSIRIDVAKILSSNNLEFINCTFDKEEVIYSSNTSESSVRQAYIESIVQ